MRISRSTRAAGALMGLAVMAGLGAASAAGQDGGAYRLVEDWPRYPAGAEFEMGTGIAVDGDGTVYAISRDIDHWASHPLAMTRYRGKGSIWKFDRDGKFLGLFAEDQAFIGPHSIYADGEGYIWVVDRDGHQVKKLTPDGTPVLTLGEYGRFGDDETHFNGPTSVAVLPSGDVVIGDGYWNSRLVWFTADGEYIRQVGEYGNGPGQLGVVHAVAVDARGRLLVANVCGGALHTYVTAPGPDRPRTPAAPPRLPQPLRRLPPGRQLRRALVGRGGRPDAQHRRIREPDLRGDDGSGTGTAGRRGRRRGDRPGRGPHRERECLRAPDGPRCRHRRHLRGLRLPGAWRTTPRPRGAVVRSLDTRPAVERPYGRFGSLRGRGVPHRRLRRRLLGAGRRRPESAGRRRALGGNGGVS